MVEQQTYAENDPSHSCEGHHTSSLLPVLPRSFVGGVAASAADRRNDEGGIGNQCSNHACGISERKSGYLPGSLTEALCYHRENQSRPPLKRCQRNGGENTLLYSTFTETRSTLNQ